MYVMLKVRYKAEVKNDLIKLDVNNWIEKELVIEILIWKRSR